MKSFLYLALFACILLQVLCVDDELQARANAYIDKFIAQATSESGTFIDPLQLDELKKSFEREIAFIKVKGEAKLYDGQISGLSSLKRKGNVTIMDLDDLLLLTTKLTFKKLHATYKGAVLLNDNGPRVEMNAKIGGSKVSMSVVVPTAGGNSSLVSFEIEKLQDIRISISGLGPWGWSASILSTLALNALEKPVAKAASVKMAQYFDKEIKNVPFPAKGEV